MSAVSIEIKSLEVRYGARAVLDQVSLRFEPGAIVGLIGPNGAGKSTLLRTICGMEPYYRGTVAIGGRDLGGIPVIERAKLVTYVGSEAETEFPLTAFEVVAMGTFPLGLRRLGEEENRRVESAMEETGCREFVHRAIPELSSGERQRVFLARALVQRPAWICLDESFSRLDLHHQARIGALLRRSAARGSSFLFVSHDLNFTTDWADRCVLMKEGRIVDVGETAAVMTKENLRKLYPDADVELSPHPVTGAMKAYFRG
jgi:iron complex transport system ATP-binding protein